MTLLTSSLKQQNQVLFNCFTLYPEETRTCDYPHRGALLLGVKEKLALYHLTHQMPISGTKI